MQDCKIFWDWGLGWNLELGTRNSELGHPSFIIRHRVIGSSVIYTCTVHQIPICSVIRAKKTLHYRRHSRLQTTGIGEHFRLLTFIQSRLDERLARTFKANESNSHKTNTQQKDEQNKIMNFYAWYPESNAHYFHAMPPNYYPYYGKRPMMVQSMFPKKKASSGQPRPEISVLPRSIGPVYHPNENDVLAGR